MSISVRFWGARGSIPVSAKGSTRYGGNTSCVEMSCGGRRLIFDAGSGIRGLGAAILREEAECDLDIFFGHLHLDHLIGLPFFSPLYEEGYRVRLWAGHLLPAMRLEDAVRQLMTFPFFPTTVEMFEAADFRDFVAGDILNPSHGIVVRTAPLCHPGGATGYRVEFSGKSVAYVTDTELGAAKSDAQIVSLVKDVDLLIVDATYTEAELPSHRGWGHSSWQDCVRLADTAGVGQLCLFHHDPSHDDAFLDGVAVAAASMRAGTIVASDGMAIEI